MTFFKGLFTPPVFNDETKTQRAFLFHVIVWTLVFVPIPFVIYTFIATPQNNGKTLAQVTILK